MNWKEQAGKSSYVIWGIISGFASMHRGKPWDTTKYLVSRPYFKTGSCKMSPVLPLELVLRERRYRRTNGSWYSITKRKTLAWQHAHFMWEKNTKLTQIFFSLRVNYDTWWDRRFLDIIKPSGTILWLSLQVFEGFLIKTTMMLLLLPSLLCRGSIVLTFTSVRLINMKQKVICATESPIFS
jgi:hypothetical protein